MDVPFEPVLYPSVGAILDSGKSGAWDVAFIGFSPERAKDWEFNALHLEVEFGYLVPGGSSIATMADVERPGVRVAVQENSGPDRFFSRTLKSVAMVRASGRRFIEEAKSEGLVKAAIEKAGLRGVVVAAPR
jgi:polar amino acid transport system substrate-binding protein